MSHMTELSGRFFKERKHCLNLHVNTSFVTARLMIMDMINIYSRMVEPGKS